MPRTAKKQPAVPYPGGQYGEGIDSVQSQKAIPLADERAPEPVGPQVLETQLPDVVARAQATPPPSPIVEPGNAMMTAGLSTGPGPGPDQLGLAPVTGTGRLFRMMAEVTGDHTFLEYARRAGL